MPKQDVAWREAAWIWGLSRCVLLLISGISVYVLPIYPTYTDPQAVTQGCVATLNCFQDAWWRWDVVHYVSIAHDGYLRLQHTVFFPLFPLLMHTLGAIFGGSMRMDYIAGCIISNVCFYGVLVLLYQLVRTRFDRVIARNTLLLLAFAPYSIFFFAGYTESLFLLLCLATFVFLERGGMADWWLAGLCGLLATLTRPTGLVLLVPLLTVFVQRFGIRTLFTRTQWRIKLNALLSMSLVPVGLLLYMLYLWIISGNPLLFSTEEALGWHRVSALPWVGSLQALRGVFDANTSIALLNIRDLAFTYIPLLALFVGWKHLPLRYSLFALCMALFLLSNPLDAGETLASAPRYVEAIFPIFLLFAIYSKRRLLATLLAPVWLIACTAITIVFVSGYWIG